MFLNWSTELGSSGSSIILRNFDLCIIVLHYGSLENEKEDKNKKYSLNLSTHIISVINDIKYKINNIIIRLKKKI